MHNRDKSCTNRAQIVIVIVIVIQIVLQIVIMTVIVIVIVIMIVIMNMTMMTSGIDGARITPNAYQEQASAVVNFAGRYEPHSITEDDECVATSVGQVILNIRFEVRGR